MSGFEVAGVVVGAVPLIVIALERYQKLGRMRDAFRKRSLHLDRMIRALKWQQRLIHSDVKIVLRNAGLDEETTSQHERLDRLQDLFEREDVQDAVRDFLGDKHDAYLEVMQDFQRTLLEIAKSIKGFQEDSWVANGSLAGMVRVNQHIDKPGSDFLKKVKFSMHKDDVERSIKDLDEHSRMLERLRERSQQDRQFIVQHSSSSTKAIVAKLRKVRIHVTNLHRALALGLTQSCHGSHEARLYLDCRVDPTGHNRMALAKQKQSDIQFGVSLRECSSKSYKTCVVEVLDCDDCDRSHNLSNSTVSFKPGIATATAIQKLDVDDMCLTLNKSMSIQKQLRLYLEEGDRLSYQYFSSSNPDPRLGHVHGGNLITLRDLLQQPAHKKSLHLNPAVHLAATMASSVLQLHATPWCGTLRNDTLLFAEDSQGTVDFSNPFVACRVHGKDRQGNTCSIQDESRLLDLGILILELWHRQNMDDFAILMGLSLEDTYDSRQSVARRWIDETKDNLLASVYDAAVICVNCRLNAAKIDLTDRKQSMSIFETVIKPLRDNCKV